MGRGVDAVTRSRSGDDNRRSGRALFVSPRDLDLERDPERERDFDSPLFGLSLDLERERERERELDRLSRNEPPFDRTLMSPTLHLLYQGGK